MNTNIETTTEASTGNRARVRRYRSNRRRFDYYPSREALKAIEQLLARNPTACIAAVLDHMVLRSVPGNAISGYGKQG